MTSVACIDPTTAASFALGELPSEDAAAVRAHLAGCVSCANMLVDEPTIGTPHGPPAGELELTRGSAIGRYIVIGKVGQGGMGAVYAAYDPELDRRVAVKLHRSRLDADEAEEWRARMLREAKAMARLSHPNVVAIHDTGVFEGKVFVAMELVEGGTLRTWLRARPDRVLVEEDGRVLVTDFGLAHSLGVRDPDAVPVGSVSSASVYAGDVPQLAAPLTHVGSLSGTPAYMSPEQFRTELTDARADQLAFCASLYQALYGELPFADSWTLRERSPHRRRHRHVQARHLARGAESPRSHQGARAAWTCVRARGHVG